VSTWITTPFNKGNHLNEKYEAILAFLTAHSIPFTVHEHAPSYTVADAGERLPFPAERLLKAIAFKIKSGGYILAAARGPDRIDYRKLAAASGAKRADIVRLTPEEVMDVFGMEVGSVSPIPLREGVSIFFDTNLPTDETVYCGIGRADRTLEIQLKDLVHITDGRVLPLINNEA
jgi:Cys-tRNA(Pro)/Cys-tRNA(Cys) deacylase